MKKYSSFNQLIVRYLFTILAVVLLGANALADTVWSAGDTTVTDLNAAGNWDNGAPVTADNPGFINGDVITVNSGDTRPVTNGQNVSWTLTGDTQVNFTGHFVPVGNSSFLTGTAAFVMRLEDNASVTVAKRYWVGNNKDTIAIEPVSGNDYIAYQYYTGNSTFTTGQAWSAGMGVKTYIQVTDNASIVSQAEDSGIGFYKDAYGSMIDMDGGSISAVNLYVQNGTMNLSGGEVIASNEVKVVDNSTDYSTVINQSGGKITAKNYVIQSSNINLSGGEVKLTGTAKIGDNSASEKTYFNQTGGKFTTSGCYFSRQNSAEIDISGGSFYSTGDFYSADAAAAQADINISGTGYWKATGGRFQLGQHGDSYLNVSDDAVVQAPTVDLSYHYTPADTSKTVIVMSDNALMTTTGDVMSFRGIKAYGSGKTFASLTLQEHARLDIAGKVWGGDNKNDSDHEIQLISDDYEYALEETFKDYSTTIIRKEWWTAVTAKTHVTMLDHATVYALTGNSGMGWGTNANGSVFDLNGGNLLVTSNQYWVGVADGGTTNQGYATMNQSGGKATITRLKMANEGSAFNLSGGEMNAGEMSVYASTNANLTGGKLTVGTLSNAGTTTLNGATINLGSHGYINSTGTFDAKSGAINVNPVSDYNYANGDQILVGSFADVDTANAAMALTSVPDGWTKGVVALNGQQAVIAQYGSAPSDVKVWTSDSTGNLSNGPWTGATSNSTGYVVGGGNTFNDFAGEVVVLGGTNKFTDNAVVHAGELLVVNGGTNTYGTANINMAGTLIVNGGTFVTGNDKNFRVYGTVASPAYVEVNGGEFLSAPRWLAIGNVNSDTQTAKVVINNGFVKCGNSSAGGLIICDAKGVTAELELNGGQLQIYSGRETKIAQNDNAKGVFTMTNGYFSAGGAFNVAINSGATGTIDISGGVFTLSNTMSVATADNSTGIINVSGGEVRINNLKLGRVNAGDSAQLNLSGGVLEITNGLYGSGSSPSGNVRITKTGQLLMNSSYSNANYAAIRELTVFEIEGSGDGAGALRFLQSSDCSAPITLTGDATIGIRTDAVFTQRAAINANSSDSVLTVKGGGTLVMTPSELGTLNKLKLDNSTMTLTGSDPINLHLSSVELDGGTLEFAEGTTYNPGTGDDEVPFTVSINDKGVVEFNGTLKLDAYQNSYMNGIDKFDFTNFEVDKSQVVFGDDFNIVVNLIDADNFTNQMVALAWAPGLPGDLINDADIAMSVLNTEGKILYWGFNADGSIFLGDANSVPEPSTWALMILGAAGLMYWRKRR